MLRDRPKWIDRKLIATLHCVAELDGAEPPDINPDIDAIQISQVLLMHMAKEHDRSLAGPVPCDHLIMTKRDVSRPILDLRQRMDGIPW